jgi:hypothetical protein
MVWMQQITGWYPVFNQFIEVKSNFVVSIYWHVSTVLEGV